MIERVKLRKVDLSFHFRASVLAGWVFIVSFVAVFGSLLHAQVRPAATRGNSFQAGATFDLAQPDFGASTLSGFGVYLTDDFRPHWGMEAEFRLLLAPNSEAGIYEKTYEIGPRYSLNYGRFKPYGKFMLGRGVFQFPPDPQHPASGPSANLAYNLFAGGVGTDFRLRPSVNLRIDYEAQRWIGFPPAGLTPRVLSVGVAYHFH